MAAPMNKAEYLKKYLSENSDEKKAKKRKKQANNVSKGVRSRIVDDDVDLKSLLPENLSNTLEEDVGDNDPTVADVIDERPEHVKQLEKYRSSGQWRVMGKSEASESSEVGRIHSDSDQSPVRARRHDSDSDQSPPRRFENFSNSDKMPNKSRKKIAKISDTASLKSHKNLKRSPVRKQRHDSDSDSSLQRNKSHNSHKSPVKRKRHDSDSDHSHKRRQRHDSDSDQSPVRIQRHDSDSDQSPARRQGHESDSDQSPLRRQRNGSDSDQSPVRRQRHDSDSDQPPPRKNDKTEYIRSNKNRKNQVSHSNISPHRKRKQNTDSDHSPPRQRRHDSDSDQSPPRRSSSKNKSVDRTSERSSSSKEHKTLGGKKAGLSSAKEMRQEAEELKRKEKAKFESISDDRLGKGAATVFRDKSGRKRDIAEERKKDKEEAKKKEKEDEKFKQWGKGLKQVQDQADVLEDHLLEMSKPLVRYKDDEDLDQMMREMEREEDPMLAFIKKKKKKTGPAVPEKPRYKGPAPPPNRFGIMPGYRWDGVNRSNGFEQQIYAKQAEKKAVEIQRYKWSTEDM